MQRKTYVVSLLQKQPFAEIKIKSLKIQSTTSAGRTSAHDLFAATTVVNPISLLIQSKQ